MANPDLGYGTRGDAPLDRFNQWFRSRPEYAAKLAGWGQTPDNVHLSDWQKQEMVRLAQSMGAVVDEGHNGQEVDDSGNFQAKSHTVRNIAIIGGIAAAALLTAGAAGAFAGAAAPAAGGTAAAAGGVEAGAAAGLGALALPGAGTALAAGTAPLVAAGGASVIPWSTIVGAGSQLFGNLFAAHEASSAADQGAASSAAAAKYSADLTAKANADALKFQYGSAENAFQNSEAARQGNYGIFAARERRLGPIGEEVGLGPREIPAYVPGVDPGFGTMGEAATGTSAAGAPPAAGGGDIMSALTKNYQALGVAPTGPGSGPTDIAYMAQRMNETGGLTPNNVSYWLGPQGRIAAELAQAKGGGQQTTQPAARTMAPATTATPFMPAQVAAGPQAIGFYA